MTDNTFDAFGAFTAQMEVDATTPSLSDQTWYPAVLVGGPTQADPYTELIYNTKPDEKRGGKPKCTLTFRWQVVINRNEDPTDFSDRSKLTPMRYYTYLARIIPDPAWTDQEAKEAFMTGKATIDGQTAGHLRTLRSVLFTNEEIINIGLTNYPLDQFYGRIFKVEIKHEPHWEEEKAALGAVQARINRLARYTDELTGGIFQVDREDIAWQPREENDTFDLG